MKITKQLLEKLFVEYNKKYFDNFLKRPKITTYIGENSMGIFSIKEGRNISEKKISIARNFNLTKEELRDLLLHEMIHEYMYMKYGKMSHNRQFVKKMNELNKKYGFDIRRNSKHLFKKYKPQKSFFYTIIGLFKKLKRPN
ncbi:MAG: SprT-like domain-containing protein [Prevotella sp.]|nr:SprT-like domain-containing protein [Prevotella sp.]